MNLLGSVENLKGIGPKTAATLKKYGIKTIRDFFYNLPRAYENYQMASTIASLRPGKVVVRGKIENLTSRRGRRRNMSITEGLIRDETGVVKVVWFNQSYRMKQFTPGKKYYFTGTYELRNGRYSLTSPSAAEVADVDTSDSLIPVYVAHGAFTSPHFRRLVNDSRDRFAEIPDLLPFAPPGARRDALFHVHFPESTEVAEQGREYLAYEELFKLILAGKLNQNENQKLQAESVPFHLEKIQKFLEKLPFRLTDAQRKASWEIFQDLERPTPMNRLLQGDVGSGKTMVAAMSAYEVAVAGGQVALLAPTAILATQHYEGLSSILEPLGIHTALLVGATKKKTELKEKIKSGKIDLVIGTHALLTDDTEFRHLSLVIIDEQHRFGVEQRQKLILKSPTGKAPHLLAMTATPIPRSLQLTVFGDLDVSILNQMPQGRQPIDTHIIKEIETREKLYPLIYDEIQAGRQVYWICKAIEDTPGAETTSVKKRTAKLKQDFPHLRVEFLHGRMKQAEKDELMSRFAAGEIDLLVSTTVVEVGINVPNATVIVIENAEMYGLAQLHQLRGRVGRGNAKSYCFLMTSGDASPSRRLRELERSTDGFHLAEVDLKLRGPGEIYGVLQHGALDLKIASFTDTHLIKRAREDVEKFLTRPADMVKYKELMSEIRDYQQITTLN
ncbi:ATP-dependent DNA helicase RecG [Candidatus Saccharibacteria bacterium]|nr:ATP-dependent DNA helicase RecG [Candidatus Saccharibacteria bacterium]